MGKSSSVEREAEAGRTDRPSRLADRAFEEIRAALLGARGDAPDRLGEEELARDLSMSRTPVREALHRLALVGLVEPTGSGGYRRRRTTPRGVREHCELRLLFEPYAAALAADRAAEEGPPGLCARAEELDARVPIEASGFHLAVAEAAGTESLPELIGELSDLAALDQVALGWREEDEWRHEHRAIAIAVDAGDPVAARAAMEAHLERITETMTAAVEAAGGGPG
ncbi:MAG TPA: GntR family transcriptional regulator [Solirubrobacterales bacterium]|nr:GntR family transcriptional regulator [Solirubrobacterales bacterium]